MIMKWIRNVWRITILTVIGFCVVSEASLSQHNSLGTLYQSEATRYQLQIDKGISLEQMLKKIEKRFEITFLYPANIMEGKKLSKDLFLSEDFRQSLKSVMRNQGLKIEKLNSKSYGISPESDRMNNVQLQETINGTVVDGETGDSLPGVNILIKNTSSGTSTDADGNYELTVPSLQDTLVVSFIGYETQEVPINGRTTVSIELFPTTYTGEELVVVGYGTQRSEELTGSVGQVKSGTIEDQPVGDVTEALQGAVANLTIQQPSGAPDAGYNINIRGISTMNNNDPLVVIDGVVGGSLSNLNPNNIENISVLKDAGSAAIYGSRAANGVLLVTTKSGQKNSEPTVTFNAQTGINAPNILYEPVNGYENAILRNQALVNSGNSPLYTPEQIRRFRQERDVEWFMDTIFQNAAQQDYNLSVSGGSDNTTYRVSGRIFDQRNNFVGDYGVRRYNIRTNVSTEYGKFDVDSKLSYQRSNIDNPTGSQGFLIADAKRTPPYYNYSLQDDEGRYLINDVLTEFNPLGILEEGGSSQATNDAFTGVLQVGYDILDNLQARASISAIINSNESLLKVQQVPFYVSATASEPANIANSDRNTNNDNYQSITYNPSFVLDYTDTFGSKHDVSGLVGVSNESFTSQSNGIHLIFTDRDLNIPISETEIQSSSYTTLETKTQNSLYSAFGRAKYAYDQRYLLEFNFRYDGSSKFLKANRWGFFPSISAAWNISDESFLQNYQENVGDLKLRASYGTLGNQSVGNYQYQTSYFTFSNAYSFNNQAVAGTGFEFANEDIQWETTTTINLGLDASFFNNSLNASIDVYQKTTDDILITPTIPGTYGGAVPDYNAGKMRNRGWEVSLNYNTGDEFSHSISLNLGNTWNEVLDFAGEEQITSSDQMQRIIREGEPFNSYYGYKVDGLFQNPQEIEDAAKPIGVTVQPGDVRYKDKNGDGVIDDGDRYVLGNAFPRYTLGFQYGLQWKGVDLSMLIQGVGKRTMFLRGENVEPFHANYAYTMYTHQTDYWTPTNPDARWPRLSAPGSASNSNNYQVSSDLYAFDASYIRLQNIKVGYTLPANLSLGAKRIHFYLNARNVFTLSEMDFLNPESTEFDNDLNAGGSNSGRSYPDIKYYGFGINLSL